MVECSGVEALNSVARLSRRRHSRQLSQLTNPLGLQRKLSDSESVECSIEFVVGVLVCLMEFFAGYSKGLDRVIALKCKHIKQVALAYIRFFHFCRPEPRVAKNSGRQLDAC